MIKYKQYLIIKAHEIRKVGKEGAKYMNIMFICTGNICRSAMAHHLLEKRLKDLKIQFKNTECKSIFLWSRCK